MRGRCRSYEYDTIPNFDSIPKPPTDTSYMAYETIRIGIFDSTTIYVCVTSMSSQNQFYVMMNKDLIRYDQVAHTLVFFGRPEDVPNAGAEDTIIYNYAQNTLYERLKAFDLGIFDLRLYSH